jgi:hypothetical protein
MIQFLSVLKHLPLSSPGHLQLELKELKMCGQFVGQ